MGVVAARVAMSLLMFILSLLAARYLIGTRVASEVRNLWQVGAACAAMASLVLILRHELAGNHLNDIIELALTAAFGAVVYVGTLFALGVRFKGYLKPVE
jgi:PST family polysaccharide transporter